MDFQAEYRSKLRTPAEAVRAVKNGDWVDYTSALGFPPLLDAALAARRDELHDVKVRGNLCTGPVQVVECDTEQAHFLYHTWHCSAYERRLCDRGLCYYTPMVFRNLAWYYREFLTVNVAMASVAPMDRHGYFNLSAATGVSRAILDRADIVILEVNEHLPRLRGGFDEVIHISDVDMVVEGARAVCRLARAPGDGGGYRHRESSPAAHLRRGDRPARHRRHAHRAWKAAGPVRPARSRHAHGAVLGRVPRPVRGRCAHEPPLHAPPRAGHARHCARVEAAV